MSDAPSRGPRNRTSTTSPSVPRQIMAGSDMTIASTAIIRVDDTTSTAASAAVASAPPVIDRLRRITSSTVTAAKSAFSQRANSSMGIPVSLCPASSTT